MRPNQTQTTHGSSVASRGGRFHWRTLVAITLGAVVSVTLTPTASQAAGPADGAVTITAGNVATYRGDCVNAPITITSHYDASGTGTYSGVWSVDVEVTDPYGAYSDSHEYGGFNTSTTFKDFLCVGRYNTGTYDITATWEQYDAQGQVIATGATTDSFTLKRKPPANTRLKVSKDPYGSTGWRFTGTLTREGRPHKWESVSLWIRWHGYWRNYRETKITGARGQVSWHTAKDIPKNRYVFQLRYKGDNRSKSVRSDRFQLPRR